MNLGKAENQKDNVKADEEDRPNIIFIITDQQRFDTIAAHGHDHMETPHLDRLVSEGVSFTNCHITAASCVPCRASLFTGYYPHVNGVLENEQLWQHTWVEKLRDAGYTCVNVGKMHTNPFNADAGFDERYIVENKDRYLQGRWYFDEWDKALAAHGLVKQQREKYRERDDYGRALGAFEWELPENLHSDVFVGNFAKWWLDTKPKAEPLFMQIGFPGPHPPMIQRPDLPNGTWAKTTYLPQKSAIPTFQGNRLTLSTKGCTTQRWTTIPSFGTLTDPTKTYAGCELTTTPTSR